jgi:hypothetical protein
MIQLSLGGMVGFAPERGNSPSPKGWKFKKYLAYDAGSVKSGVPPPLRLRDAACGKRRETKGRFEPVELSSRSVR